MYIGCEKYPLGKNKKPTVAPGQYNFVQSGLGWLYGYSVDFIDVTGPVWVIIHADVCDIAGTDYSAFGDYYIGVYCQTPPEQSGPAPVTGNESVESSEITLTSFPNPFNTSAKVQFSLPEAGNVTLEVYNLSGARIITLFEGFAEANKTYTYDFNGEANLYQATYIVVIRSASGTKYQRLMMIR